LRKLVLQEVKSRLSGPDEPLTFDAASVGNNLILERVDVLIKRTSDLSLLLEVEKLKAEMLQQPEVKLQSEVKIGFHTDVLNPEAEELQYLPSRRANRSDTLIRNNRRNPRRRQRARGPEKVLKDSPRRRRDVKGRAKAQAKERGRRQRDPVRQADLSTILTRNPSAFKQRSRMP
jgi:hypothetical protein